MLFGGGIMLYVLVVMNVTISNYVCFLIRIQKQLFVCLEHPCNLCIVKLSILLVMIYS